MRKQGVFFQLWEDMMKQSKFGFCANVKCVENAEGNCRLKVVDIDKDGMCRWCLPKERLQTKE